MKVEYDSPESWTKTEIQMYSTLLGGLKSCCWGQRRTSTERRERRNPVTQRWFISFSNQDKLCTFSACNNVSPTLQTLKLLKHLSPEKAVFTLFSDGISLASALLTCFIVFKSSYCLRKWSKCFYLTYALFGKSITF